MRFLSGVVTYRWGPKIDRAIELADQASWTVLEREGLITRGRDGMHSSVSLHYYRKGRPSEGAFDLRTWTRLAVPSQILPAKRRAYRDDLQRRLDAEFPDEFDVVAEATHLHVEHDP